MEEHFSPTLRSFVTFRQLDMLRGQHEVHQCRCECMWLTQRLATLVIAARTLCERTDCRETGCTDSSHRGWLVAVLKDFLEQRLKRSCFHLSLASDAAILLHEKLHALFSRVAGNSAFRCCAFYTCKRTHRVW